MRTESIVRAPVLVLAAVALNVSVAAAQAVDHHVQSRPENIAWGWFPIEATPVVTISISTVRCGWLWPRS